MRPFTYERANDLNQAARLGQETGQGQVDARSQYLAGGTTLIDLMKLDVLRPLRLIDLGGVASAHRRIEAGPQGLHLGAFATMAAAADHPDIQAHYPVIAQSLQLAASAQLRNMATLGGNVLQKTRCTYYRDPSWAACNKRTPGSGCAAITGFNRNHAILGVDDNCIAQYPGDFAVALIALDADVQISGPRGSRRVAFASLHRSAGQPHLEHTLGPSETIIGFDVPAGPWTARSIYLKVRDRASYEFAIASAAVALDMEGDIVRTAKIALGGMAYKPWRAEQAEASLIGKTLTETSASASADMALQGARTHGHNDYKPKLARQTIIRALLEAKSMPAGARPV
ncbi:MAG TPA: xanthine dehydrogenase family protein subunit M [Steroidobacteraceae bacterium]|jgi:xanthine dehydrogenase YagS FAD-binding subunit